MIEWGIYTEETQEQFLFLSPGPKCNGKIISSLQAFETSLLMVGLGCWTNAVVCLCNAIEIITKIEFPKGQCPDDRHFSFFGKLCHPRLNIPAV